MKHKTRASILAILVLSIFAFVSFSERSRILERQRLAEIAKEEQIQKEIKWAIAMVNAPTCHYALGMKERAYKILNKYRDRIPQSNTPAQPVKLSHKIHNE